MTQVVCWTDGGCRGNPGIGGWGFVLVDTASGKALERCGGERDTTNNRMEIGAALHALETLRADGTSILIHSDSRYLIDCATQWIRGWKAKGWKKKDGELKNVDLLQRLDALLARHQVSWQWVKGHAGDPGNEHVDALTNRAMDALAARRDPAHERRFTCTWNYSR